MPAYPPGYDPTYDFEMPPNGYVLMGLLGVVALAGIGAAAFFTYEAAAAGPIVLSGVTYTTTVEGVTTTGTVVYSSIGTGLTPIQVTGLATIRAFALSGTAPTTVAKILQAYGFTRVGTTVNMLAIAAYGVGDELMPGTPGNPGSWVPWAPGNIPGNGYYDPGAGGNPGGFQFMNNWGGATVCYGTPPVCYRYH